MKIPQPSLSPHHPDYDLSCQVALDLPIQELVEGAVQAGWRRADVLSALEEVAEVGHLSIKRSRIRRTMPPKAPPTKPHRPSPTSMSSDHPGANSANMLDRRLWRKVSQGTGLGSATEAVV